MNNNPFQPTNPLPPVMYQGDANADNFAAQPVTFENFAPAGAPASPPPAAPTQSTPPPAPKEDIPDPVPPTPVRQNVERAEVPQPMPNPNLDKFDSLMMGQVDNMPANLQPVKTRHLSISILTLLFFVLALAGIGGTVYFFLENNKSIDERDAAKAEVTRLENENRNNSHVTDMGSSQFDTLQEKIATLTKKDDENTKTIEDLKKQIEELNKKNETLTTEKADLQKKATDISKLTTKLDKVLENCKIVTTGTPKTCTFGIE